MAIAFSPNKINKIEKHISESDFYWDVTNGDGEYDGFVHIVSIRDGSEIKINLDELLKLVRHS